MTTHILQRQARPPDRVLHYGADVDQVVDVWEPAAGLDRPVVVAIHGGFWRSEFDRRHLGPFCAALASYGYPTCALEYRRTGQPAGGWPSTFADVALALDTLPLTLGMKRCSDGVLLVGHSAGGQLALWVTGRGPSDALAPCTNGPSQYLGVVALAPICDLIGAARLQLDDGAALALMGGRPEDVPGRYAAVDPMLRPPIRLPCVLIHGIDDDVVPVAMSRRYVGRTSAGSAMVRLCELAGASHYDLIDPQSPYWSEVISTVEQLTK